jgi:hypothetical protein
MDAEYIDTLPFNVFKGGYAGTVLLHRDTMPLAANVNREMVIVTDGCNAIGGDIYADQACTLQLSVSPDGDNYGMPSELNVPAGEMVRFEYPGLFARTVKLVATNGATPMTVFRLFVRGGS